jgi:hypothetical protein
MEELFKGFKEGLEDLDRNEILASKEDKNSIVCQLITDMVAEHNRFTLPEKVYGDQTCGKCNGLGFKVLFERTLSVRTCLKCKDGKKQIPCKKCQNGRFIRDKGALKINVECKFCHGTKVREVKCRTCRGTSELKKMVITPKIKSITPCKHCRELGFIDEKIFSIVDDTQKFEDAAEQLLECLIQPPQDSIDPELEMSDAIPVKTDDVPSDTANTQTE